MHQANKLNLNSLPLSFSSVQDSEVEGAPVGQFGKCIWSRPTNIIKSSCSPFPPPHSHRSLQNLRPVSNPVHGLPNLTLWFIFGPCFVCLVLSSLHFNKQSLVLCGSRNYQNLVPSHTCFEIHENSVLLCFVVGVVHRLFVCLPALTVAPSVFEGGFKKIKRFHSGFSHIEE